MIKPDHKGQEIWYLTCSYYPMTARSYWTMMNSKNWI